MTKLLGCSDLRVGDIAYGCSRWADMQVGAARAVVEAAVEAGMTLIDTADIYPVPSGSPGEAEALLGEVLASAPDLKDGVVVATKGGISPGVPYDASAARLRAACESSLRRLRLEVIDLYQVHRPDLLAHPAEVAQVLTDLRTSGKVREVGICNYTPAQAEALQHHLGFPLVTHQFEFSLLHLRSLEDGSLEHAMRVGLTPLAWGPLAGGSLLRTPVGGPEPGSTVLSRALGRLAERWGCAPAALALAFLMRHPSGVTPIVGTTRPDRIGAAAAAREVTLTRAEWYELATAAGMTFP